MNFLAISGSARAASSNTELLRAVADIARPVHSVTVFGGLADLPVFSPDFEKDLLPVGVQKFANKIRLSDGIIIASPEYVRSIPGGLKNAIDWLVSRDEIIHKPVALMHASHRGDDMLAQLRLVMSTVSQRFSLDIFARFDLLKLTPRDVEQYFSAIENRAAVKDFLDRFAEYCRENGTSA